MGVERSLNLPALVDFYDRMIPESIGHAAAINAVMGEELASTLFLDFAARNNLDPSIIPSTCTQGTKKGVRLDCWIQIIENGKTIHFQTEIKNWSAHSYSGKRFPDIESESSLISYRISRWENQFDQNLNTLRKKEAKKVLTRMKAPDPTAEIRPLIIFWDSMHPKGSSEPFFSVKVNDPTFNNLWIFSMSTHVRNLINQGISEIRVDISSVIERLVWLNKLYKN